MVSEMIPKEQMAPVLNGKQNMGLKKESSETRKANRQGKDMIPEKMYYGTKKEREGRNGAFKGKGSSWRGKVGGTKGGPVVQGRAGQEGKGPLEKRIYSLDDGLARKGQVIPSKPGTGLVSDRGKIGPKRKRESDGLTAIETGDGISPRGKSTLLEVEG